MSQKCCRIGNEQKATTYTMQILLILLLFLLYRLHPNAIGIPAK